MIDNAHGTLLETYLALSRLISVFHIDIDGFCKTLKKQHIINISQTSRTITATALRSGMDRRIVAKVLADDQTYHKPPLLPNILIEIEKIALKNNRMVKKYGTDSVESIMHDVASGATTLKSIINILVQLDCIEEQEQDIRFIANRINMTEHRRLILQQFSTEFSGWVERILVGYEGNNNQ